MANTYSLVSTTPIKIRTFPSPHPKTFLLAFCSHSPHLCPRQPRYGFYHHKILSLFCIWLLSFSIMLLRFIQAMAYINNSSLFIAEKYSITCMYHILDAHQQTKERQSNPSLLAPMLLSLKASLTVSTRALPSCVEVPHCAIQECGCEIYNLVTKTQTL